MELHEEHVSKVYATIIPSVKLCIELQDLHFCVQNLCLGLGDVCIFLRVSGCLVLFFWKENVMNEEILEFI
jgi:hypothetical protein